jgi:hypothetical protein
MSIHGKMVSNDAVVGGTITACEIWGPTTVLGTDGSTYEIRVLDGHSGPENCVFETGSSVAVRAAATRKAREET